MTHPDRYLTNCFRFCKGLTLFLSKWKHDTSTAEQEMALKEARSSCIAGILTWRCFYSILYPSTYLTIYEKLHAQVLPYIIVLIHNDIIIIAILGNVGGECFKLVHQMRILIEGTHYTAA